jgi:hypothetical protein
MISKDELLKSRDIQYSNDYTQEISDNLDRFLIVANKIRDAYGKPMTVNSGWRPPSINAATAGAATHSLHMQGLAMDISDPDNSLMNWVLQNLDLMKKLGVFIEDFRWCGFGDTGPRNWVHFGLGAPASGHRIFVPSSAPPQASTRWDGQYDHSFDE